MSFRSGQFNIAIIGTGFSGLGIAIKLKEAGYINFRIYERGSEVGGTWRDNTYPGAACDVQSHLYSYSFEPYAEWSRAFGEQGEILDYIRHCVDKYDLHQFIEFNTTISSATFDDQRNVWKATTEEGKTIEANLLIAGHGSLSDPAYPQIEGFESFEGKVLHTAVWDHDYDLTGKRVAVIGSGASAIQVVPAIADQVSKLSVFQRTPSWVLPKPDRTFDAVSKNRFRRFPLLQYLRRQLIYWGAEAKSPAIVYDTPLTPIAQRMGEKHIKSIIKDPEMRRKVTPDYKVGCKRTLLSNEWYPALVKPNVDLITDGVREIRGNTIIDGTGRAVEVDAIVCATGFKVPTEAAPYPITGANGLSINDAWADGAEAYKGVTVSGFPNLMLLMGPNTVSGHTSMIFYFESQFNYIMDMVRQMDAARVASFDVHKHVQDKFNTWLQNRMKKTTWMSACNSWYLTSLGKNTALWPGFSWEYRLQTRKVRLKDYQLTPVEAPRPVSLAESSA